jgi:hypothetical protein
MVDGGELRKWSAECQQWAAAAGNPALAQKFRDIAVRLIHGADQVDTAPKTSRLFEER